MAWIDAKNLQRIRPGHEFQLFERQFQGTVLRMSLYVCVKLRRGEAAIDHVAFELGHVDAVGGKAAESLV